MGKKRARKNHEHKTTIPKYGVRRNSIPTEEEFARADAMWQQDNCGLAEVETKIEERFRASGLHKAHLFYSRDRDEFGVLLFFQTNNQMAAAPISGLTAKIEQAVIEELVRVGRGTPETLKVRLELDSDEQVQRDYGGNYFFRLR